MKALEFEIGSQSTSVVGKNKRRALVLSLVALLDLAVVFGMCSLSSRIMSCCSTGV